MVCDTFYLNHSSRQSTLLANLDQLLVGIIQYADIFLLTLLLLTLRLVLIWADPPDNMGSVWTAGVTADVLMGLGLDRLKTLVWP